MNEQHVISEIAFTDSRGNCFGPYSITNHFKCHHVKLITSGIEHSAPLMVLFGQLCLKKAMLLYNCLGKSMGFQMAKCVSDLFLPRQEHGRQQLEVWATRGQVCLYQEASLPTSKGGPPGGKFAYISGQAGNSVNQLILFWEEEKGEDI